ncbi:hypothetical protein AB0C14_31665 [Microbispora hainanensis]|uniref:hypothetical protein n=1 Tax=Microbispora hainanensis TaxID=568844 RepID=UPI0016665F1C|nr:hypothetical protein [Microbispora rosea]GGO11950.1 hypothetical protein GCM10010116_23990 [Microbispora rosea subsp. aerata]GIH55672.1 hypothetical protein Mro02_25860 [Microbispora rosea subsp. aerata]GLJ86030.1 hypothetical protein GCM10017588_47630 [Microbispora rosea subsp. aerata]
MSCEHLICAACAGPVVEGRCPVCREGRAKVHHHGFLGLSPLVIALIVLLVVALVALTHVSGY